MEKVIVRLTDGQMEQINETESMISELAELKRDGVEVNMPESQAKCIRALFNAILDFISIDYE